ncbi:Rv3235 family protein [Nocardioides sp.]|uniref:Rv3235 family protein n=1 Tax=Nocardioides sp. TaxID=35761 RepID=UPI0035136C3B
MTALPQPLLLPFRAPAPVASTQGSLALALLPRQGPPEEPAPDSAPEASDDGGPAPASPDSSPGPAETTHRRPRPLPPRPAHPRVGADVVGVEARLRRTIEEWTHRFAQAAVEIVGGDRPVTQLVRWTSSTVYEDLRRRAHLVALAGGHQPGLARVQPVRPRVHSVRTCFLSEDVVECGVHVRYGPRSRAVALRFERRQQRWICTAADFA